MLFLARILKRRKSRETTLFDCAVLGFVSAGVLFLLLLDSSSVLESPKGIIATVISPFMLTYSLVKNARLLRRRG